MTAATIPATSVTVTVAMTAAAAAIAAATASTTTATRSVMRLLNLALCVVSGSQRKQREVGRPGFCA